MKTKHTQGKWNLKVNTILGTEKLIEVENICVMKGTDKEAEANAKLIATAPELLGSLMMIIASYGPLISKELNEKAFKAIQKATL